MSFHPLILCGKLSIQHGEEGSVGVDGVRGAAFLVQPRGDDLRVCLHAGLFVRDDKHLVRDEVEPILGGLALDVADVHDPTHVHVAQVVPSSARQHLQGCDGVVGGLPAPSEPVDRLADGERRAVKEKGKEQQDCCLHGVCGVWER